MKIQTTVRHVENWAETIETVNAQAVQLEDLRAHIVRTRVAVERTHRSSGRGDRHRVRVLVTVPGAQFAAVREAGPGTAHPLLADAVADCFTAARRMVIERLRRLGPSPRPWPAAA
jgi:hypothetical protein